MKYIFLDTMVFLHYRDFSEIDFLSLFGREPTTIIILDVVAYEIDKHKDQNPSKKIKHRALNVNKRISEILKDKDSAQLRDNLTIKFLHPSLIDLASMGLDVSRNDHCIIGAIIDYATRINKEEDSILFITHDIASTCIARRKGIVVKTLPDEYRLAEELDENEKELQLLRKEIAKLKSTSPQLALRANETLGNVVSILPENIKTFKKTEYITLENIIKKIPLAEYKNNNNNSEETKKPTFAMKLENVMDSMGPMDTRNLTESIKRNKKIEDIFRYNKEREQYFKAYEEYIEKIKEQEKNILIEINLHVENIGNKPAEGVDIYLHFPDGFDMFETDTLPEKLIPPREPQRPRTSIDLFCANMKTLSLDGFPRNLPRFSKAIPKTFSLKKTNSYEFNNHVEMIKHGNHNVYDLPTLYLCYKDISEVKSFSMKYRLDANNIPTVTTGEIIFKFDCSNFKGTTSK